MKFFIYTLGCKVNQYESSALGEKLKEQGFSYAQKGERVDLYIINSCTVTANGDKKARQAVGRFKKDNPDSIIVLTGCYPQAFPEKVKKIENVDIITGTTDRANLVKTIMEFVDTKEKTIAILPHTNVFEEFGGNQNEKTRALIKIQDGCDRYCSYCIIPTARGPVRSRSLSSIISEVNFHALSGHKEVVLVGINLACYGRELGLGLVDAVEAACSVDGISRVRIGSLEPEMITKEDIMRMSQQEKFCPHFHMSIQSGCDNTLSRMERHYNSREYMEIVQNLRDAFPNCGITTDVMVGFPGESEEDFRQSLEFVESVGYGKIHVFPYSVRSGTKAENFPNQVSAAEKTARAREMTAVAEKAEGEFLQKQVGSIQTILIEKPTSPMFVNGFTPNYTPVKVFSAELSRHDLVKVKITGVLGNDCIGEVIEIVG